MSPAAFAAEISTGQESSVPAGHSATSNHIDGYENGSQLEMKNWLNPRAPRNRDKRITFGHSALVKTSAYHCPSGRWPVLQKATACIDLRSMVNVVNTMSYTDLKADDIDRKIPSMHRPAGRSLRFPSGVHIN